MSTDPTPRPVASIGQGGDTSIGQAAGGNIVHGMDPGEALAFVRDYMWRMDQQREQRDRELSDALSHLTNQFQAYQIMDSRRQAADDKERIERREALDDTLDAIAAALAAQADALADVRQGQRITRRWLVGLAVVLVLAAAVVVWLVSRELAALAVRALLEATSPVLALWRR